MLFKVWSLRYLLSHKCYHASRTWCWNNCNCKTLWNCYWLSGSLAPTRVCLYHVTHTVFNLYFLHETLLHGNCFHISNVFFFFSFLFFKIIFIVINTYFCILYTHFLLQAQLTCHGAKGQIASLLLGQIERQTIIHKSLTATCNSPVIFFGMLGKGGMPEQNPCRHRKNMQTPNRNAPGLGIEPTTFCEATVL